MGLTFANQKTLLSGWIGDPNTTTDDAFPLTTRELFINRGELMFAKRSKSYLGYVTSTVSSQQIALPSGFLGVHLLVLDDIPLTGKHEMSLQDWDQFVDSGEDNYYFWVNASGTRLLNFIDSSANSKTYRLYFFKKPTTTLSSDNDESPFQDEYREGSVHYAVSQLLPQIGKTQLAEYHLAKFNELAEEAEEETKKHIIQSTRAYPDVNELHDFDKDVQGVGQVNS